MGSVSALLLVSQTESVNGRLCAEGKAVPRTRHFVVEAQQVLWFSRHCGLLENVNAIVTATSEAVASWWFC